MTDPTRSQTVAVLEAISKLANVVAVNFFPTWVIFELETSDQRTYQPASLPGVVAGRTALYHHEDTPLLPPLRSLTPACLLKGIQPSSGSWIEIDGASFGLFSLMKEASRTERPQCLYGNPRNPFTQWHTGNIHRVFGNGNNPTSDSVCGAPIVDVDCGGVAGFFTLSNGVYAFGAYLNDLVVMGWDLESGTASGE